jgi:hypothetical protein
VIWWRVAGIALAVLIAIAGVVAIAYVLVLVVALNSLGSNK